MFYKLFVMNMLRMEIEILVQLKSLESQIVLRNAFCFGSEDLT